MLAIATMILTSTKVALGTVAASLAFNSNKQDDT